MASEGAPSGASIGQDMVADAEGKKRDQSPILVFTRCLSKLVLSAFCLVQHPLSLPLTMTIEDVSMVKQDSSSSTTASVARWTVHGKSFCFHACHFPHYPMRI